jgi:hypothetical protein
MLVKTEMHSCHCGKHNRTPRDEGHLRLCAEVSQRLKFLLQTASYLTENPSMAESDIIALDVLLEAARDSSDELIYFIGQLTGKTTEEEAQTLRC